MVRKLQIICILLIFSRLTVIAQAPQVHVEISPNTVENNEPIAIKVIITNSDEYNVSEIPDFKNFKKQTRSIAHFQTLINGKKRPQHIITQNYLPEKCGKLNIPNFTIIVNQKNVEVAGTSINVVGDAEIENKNFKEIEDISLILEHSKSSIYVGEGEKITLGFYVSNNTTSQINFPANISEQIENIAKKIKPKDCLESRSIISNIVGQKVNFNQKEYNYYKLFEAIYYPLNDKKLFFQSVSLKMEKLVNNTRILKEWNTRPVTIIIKKLPEHPLKDQVAIGNFSMIETLKSSEQYTGESFDYKIKIEGDGNFNTLNINKIENSSQFEFYATNPSINQNLGELQGFKEFGFKIIPKDSGRFNFSNLFSMIYFNVESGKFDTLKSSKTVKVLGQSLNNDEVKIRDIYFGIDKLKTDKKTLLMQEITKYVGNFFVAVMALFFVYIIKKQNNE